LLPVYAIYVHWTRISKFWVIILRFRQL